MQAQWRIHFGEITLFVTCLFAGCGGGGTSSSGNSSPSITSISPTSTEWNGPAFTLTVNGSAFASDTTVRWNGNERPTTFVSANQVTAQIPATDTLASGTDEITVVTSGGTSSSAPFTVPCVLASAGPASTQTVARLGAYYFDGWSGPLSNFHFDNMVNGPYQDREPLSGWQDNTSCAVEQQFAWAHEFGINFFVFDWYYDVAQNEYEGDNLNNALQMTKSLSNRHGMQFAIQYVDDGSFIVPSADWNSTINEWLGYMSDPDYVRVNGKPLVMFYSMGLLEQAFGSSTAVAALLNQLRTAAQASGLPGVYIVGGIDASYNLVTQTLNINDLSASAADGYDAYSFYNIAITGNSPGAQPFSVISDAGQAVWAYVLTTSPLPFIPVAVAGWDTRPVGPQPESNWWATRTPQDVSSLASAAITWAASNPSLRPEPAPTPPLVIIEAWNELSEGAYLVPTVGDGTSYGDALSAMLVTQAGNVPTTAAPALAPGATIDRYSEAMTAGLAGRLSHR
jgi:glycosyl transferase family WbsX/IPT/TIG domain-containing protein